MPTFTGLGSPDTTSSRRDPVTLRPELQSKLPVLDGQAITDERAIQNSLTNNTSFNQDSFREMRSWAAGFPEGRIISVTYFSQNAPITDVQSKVSDLVAMVQDDVHISLTQIRNMELRCSREISFDYDEENNKTSVTSEVIFFPEFRPRVGDIILYGVRNGRIGCFKVSNVKRLALGHETYHSGEITMQGWLTPTLRDRLQKQSAIIMYFDKEKFLVGNTRMLTTEGYIQQKELKHIREEIVQDYINEFYSSDMSSFMRPDNVYDPYVVEYWLRKVSVYESYQRPVQLLIMMQSFNHTIWSVLTNHPIKSLTKIKKKYIEQKWSSNFWGTNITSLIGHKFVLIEGEPAAKSNEICTTDGTATYADVGNNPYLLFDNDPMRELSKRMAKQDFIDARIKFYGGFLPFRKCAPHQHSIEPPFPCDFSKCEEYEKHPDYCHIRKYKRPPFPIKSNNDLFNIWMRLRNYPEGTILTENMKAEFRGYLEWYRKEYPGTYSDKELESMFRNKIGIGNELLSDKQKEDLKEYIHSYRTQFLPVLVDRELELLYRLRNKIPYNTILNHDQIEACKEFILVYRDWHGYPPADNRKFSELGESFTDDEVSQMENREVDSDNLLLDDYEHAQLREGVPVIYRQRHPLPHAHVHCHSVCHALCGISKPTTNIVEQEPTYGLSDAFYQGSSLMDPFERLVYDAITNQNIDPAKILDAVSRYMEWDEHTAFYRHMFSLFLIDKALYWLRFHS